MAPGCGFSKRSFHYCIRRPEEDFPVMRMNSMALPRQPLPRLALVRQHLRTEHIGNPREEACAKLLAAGLGSKIGKGSHVAITAGSRGPGGFVELLNGICDAIRRVGGEPFIVPSMGSH